MPRSIRLRNPCNIGAEVPQRSSIASLQRPALLTHRLSLLTVLHSERLTFQGCVTVPESAKTIIKLLPA